MVTIDLKELFNKSFGYDSTAEFNIDDAVPRVETSLLGQPYYAEDVFGREFFLPIKLNDYLLPFALISVTPKKTIVETPMPQRGGSVNEIITIDDYVFDIKGMLVSKDNSFPEQQMMEMHEIFKINASITLRSVVSDIFLSGLFEHKVIVLDMKWTAVAGVENAKPFELRLKSDMINTLTID
jgi:hypothetical protein